MTCSGPPIPPVPCRADDNGARRRRTAVAQLIDCPRAHRMGAVADLLQVGGRQGVSDWIGGLDVGNIFVPGPHGECHFVMRARVIALT